jgi:N6-adenosine-specific RNA methylase IME4
MIDRTIPFHEGANLFPLMDEARFAELVDDIAEHGQRQPIVLCDGQILDGRNRYRACLQLGIEPKFVDYLGNPYDYAWSANGQRRDMGLEQRAAIKLEVDEKSDEWDRKQNKVAERANAARGQASQKRERDEAGAFTSPAQTLRDTGRDHTAERENKTATAVAKEVGTCTRIVERQVELRSKRPDLAAKVRSGEMKPTEAMRQMKKDEVVKKIAALPDGKYRVIYADPPWDYNNEFDVAGYTTVAATDHYPVMPLSKICALDVKSLAVPGSVLLLWATFPLLPQALEVVKAWGFTYKTAFVWHKSRGAFGHYHKADAELLLLATRGSWCVPDIDDKVSQVQSFARANHSRKPDEWRELIDRLWPHGSRIELFARGHTSIRWHVWGAESEAAPLLAAA